MPLPYSKKRSNTILYDLKIIDKEELYEGAFRVFQSDRSLEW